MPGVTRLVTGWSLRKAGAHFLPGEILFRNLPVTRHYQWAAPGILNICSSGEGAQLLSPANPVGQNYFKLSGSDTTDICVWNIYDCSFSISLLPEISSYSLSTDQCPPLPRKGRPQARTE